MNIKELVIKIQKMSDCRIFEPKGLPVINDKNILPSDVREFYELCGGLLLYENADYPIYIVQPQNCILANPVIVGGLYEEDISSNWYIIANDGNNEYLTIDMCPERLGKCYDSFFDRHGVVGESQVIALSFTNLLERLIDNRGQYWYWLKKDFELLGDAYDD